MTKTPTPKLEERERKGLEDTEQRITGRRRRLIHQNRERKGLENIYKRLQENTEDSHSKI